jgi:hypothetical protein
LSVVVGKNLPSNPPNQYTPRRTTFHPTNALISTHEFVLLEIAARSPAVTKDPAVCKPASNKALSMTTRMNFPTVTVLRTTGCDILIFSGKATIGEPSGGDVVDIRRDLRVVGEPEAESGVSEGIKSPLTATTVLPPAVLGASMLEDFVSRLLGAIFPGVWTIVRYISRRSGGFSLSRLIFTTANLKYGLRGAGLKGWLTGGVREGRRVRRREMLWLVEGRDEGN